MKSNAAPEHFLTPDTHDLVMRLITALIVAQELPKHERNLCLELSTNAADEAFRSINRAVDLCEPQHQFIIMALAMIRINAATAKSLTELVDELRQELNPDLIQLRAWAREGRSAEPK